MKYKLIIIGGGPAGVMCGLQVNNKDTLLIDANEQLLYKMKHSGGGRCNITNNNTWDEFFHNINEDKFLMSTLRSYDNSDLLNYIKSIGVDLKLEGIKYFPKNNKSQTIIDAITNEIKFDVSLNNKVFNVEKENDIFKLNTNKGVFECQHVVVACGGKTYKHLGASEFAYTVAKHFGHDVKSLYPTNVALKANIAKLAGVPLKQVGLSFQNKTITDDMLFTHFGLSGPGVFKLTDKNIYQGDFKINVANKTYDECIKWLKQSFNSSNKLVINFLKDVAPESYLKYILGSVTSKVCNSINNKEFDHIAKQLTSFIVPIKSHHTFDTAFTTGGGVSKKEINPKTFESKKENNLYFIGECIDIFAPTGGYNLTINFSMGHSCGTQIKKSLT